MFKGFTDATTDFLWNIRFNNEREWFNEHKQEYIDHLWEPFKALAHDVYDHYVNDLKENSYVKDFWERVVTNGSNE